MSLAIVAALAGLALVDSTSIGTLLLPIAMLAHSRLRPGQVLLYLGVVGGFYWLLGLALLAGADAVLTRWDRIGESHAAAWVLMVIGVAMVVVSFWPDTPWGKRRGQRARSVGAQQRWRDRLVGEHSRPATVVAVGLGAGVVEAATMLPYLAAIGIITASGLSWAGGAAVLSGYVLVMIAPALMLLGLRVLLHDRLTPLLEQLDRLVTRHTGGAIWWVVGIGGALLALDSAARLGLWG